MGSRASPSASGKLKWLTYFLFMLFALTSESVGVIIPAVIREFHLGMTVAGAFHYATMAGIALGGVLLGGVSDRFGPKTGILLGLAAFGLSSGLFAVNHRFGAFVVLLFLGGLAIGVFKTGALTLIGDVTQTPREHTFTMNMAEGFFGIGAVIGPAVVAYLLGGGYSWTWIYVVAAVLCLLLAVVTVNVRFPAHVRNEKSSRTSDFLAILRDPTIWFFGGAAMLYVGVETAIYVWMPTLLSSRAASWPLLAAYALSVFFILRAAGRFIGAWLLSLLKWELVIAITTGAILLCFGVSLASPDRLAVFLLPLSGLFMSVVYPTINSRALSGFSPARQGAVAGVMLFFTCASAVVAPLAMGALSDLYGDPIGGFALAVMLAVGLWLMATANLWVWPAAIGGGQLD